VVFLPDLTRSSGRFSHGEVVYVSELRPFLELDLSNLLKGSTCLARYEDGIWYPARIQGQPPTRSVLLFGIVGIIY